MQVLLVDDEKELASAMAERLRLRGIDAEWATTADDALMMIDAVPFDIAVLDIKMPRIGGLELMHRIRVKHPEIKILFLTGHGSEELFQKVIDECGESAYLIKPIEIAELVDKMKRLMGRPDDRPG